MKPGDKVSVLLNEKHEITDGDEAIWHPATFLRYHADLEWCDVELEKEHAGGKKTLAVPVLCVVKV